MKVYLKDKMGGEVVAGDATKILSIQVENIDTAEGVRSLYYVEATDKERASLIALGFVVELDVPLPKASPTIAEQIRGEVKKEEELKAYDGVNEPDHFFCPEHGENHKRGTALYYACLDGYLNVHAGKETTPAETTAPAPVVSTEPPSVLTLNHVTTRVAKFLGKAGIKTVEQLLTKSVDDLVSINGIGKTTARWILSEAREIE